MYLLLKRAISHCHVSLLERMALTLYTLVSSRCYLLYPKGIFAPNPSSATSVSVHQRISIRKQNGTFRNNLNFWPSTAVTKKMAQQNPLSKNHQRLMIATRGSITATMNETGDPWLGQRRTRERTPGDPKVVHLWKIPKNFGVSD